MSDIELCRVQLPAPMSVVGIVGKLLGEAFPTARASMQGDHFAVVIDESEFQTAYDALTDAEDEGEDD